MNPSTSRLIVLIGLLTLAALYYVHPKFLPTEEERIAAANEQYFHQIYQRCQSVPELASFIQRFPPTSANEGFDSETRSRVVEVVMLCRISERYEAFAIAPVTLDGQGQYQLTGDPQFRITDHEGIFCKIYPNRRGYSDLIILNAAEWRAFLGAGGDIESLRNFRAISRDA